MDIEGTYTLQASPADVWNCLMDQQKLRKAIPGLEQIEVLGEDTYAITMHISLTPFTGSFQGQVTVTEQQFPYQYHIAIAGEGRQSSISGSGNIQLSELGENSVINYKGTLNLGKLETLFPIAVARGTAKLLIQQFFASLSTQLPTTGPLLNSTTEQTHSLPIRELPGGKIILLPPTPPPSASTAFLHNLVRRLGLGAGDPLLEAQWVNRVKRSGIVLGLLLLVWVGTRLPKRSRTTG